MLAYIHRSIPYASKIGNLHIDAFDMYIHTCYTLYIHRRTPPTFSPLGCTARPRADPLAIAASVQREAEDARTRCHWVYYTNLARLPRPARPDRSHRGTRKGDYPCPPNRTRPSSAATG